MHEVKVRKMATVVEYVYHEGGPVAEKPLRRGAVLAVIQNPFAGKYFPEIAEFMDDLKPLGLEMAKSLVAALGGAVSDIEGYGKGAIVGAAGELEHGAGCADHPHQCVVRAQPLRFDGSGHRG